MRYLLAVLLAAAVLVPRVAHAGDWRDDTCRFARLDGKAGFSTKEVARTIECATAHWDPVSGGTTKALDVARCESGLDAREHANPPYIGVYQFHPSTWDSATSSRRAFMRRWDISGSAWNGRANVLIAARIFSHTWDPWGCA